ncbi:hypothetical protein RRF57_003286 [Xylaria bambusicola]|uniref:Uncharacterized protein n=1 Tax=Xylaria bambusicola TaxID=326684 RepID=A0AAN7Z2M4_9PEZI
MLEPNALKSSFARGRIVTNRRAYHYKGGGSAGWVTITPQDAYFQPASLSLRAYILPISPMPMMPTMKFSISGGTYVSVLKAIVAKL